MAKRYMLCNTYILAAPLFRTLNSSFIPICLLSHTSKINLTDKSSGLVDLNCVPHFMAQRRRVWTHCSSHNIHARNEWLEVGSPSVKKTCGLINILLTVEVTDLLTHCGQGCVSVCFYGICAGFLKPHLAFHSY